MTDAKQQQLNTSTTHPFSNLDSAFAPTALRASFAPSSGHINQPQDTLTEKLNLLLDHNRTTDDNFTRLRSEVGAIKIDVQSVNALKYDNQQIK